MGGIFAELSARPGRFLDGAEHVSAHPRRCDAGLSSLQPPATPAAFYRDPGETFNAPAGGDARGTLNRDRRRDSPGTRTRFSAARRTQTLFLALIVGRL